MTLRTAALAAALALVPWPVQASFHFMQVEQVIGGMHGDAARQAVQLRMLVAGQSQVGNARLVAYDAAGQNPVVLVEFANAVPNAAQGARILVATPKFATSPELSADFVLDHPIPEHYLAAGRLTFETHGNLVYWSLCWGGDAYTGDTGGTSTNDDDGDFGPCLPGPLPADARNATLFAGAASGMSSSNADDYTSSADPALFTANDGSSATVSDVVVFAGGFDR